MPARKAQSRIDQLAVRDLVEKLFEATLTYDEIIATVQRETGATLTTSALSRAHQRWAADQVSEAAILREIETLTRLLQGEGGVDLNSSLMALFKKKLAQRLARADATFDDASMLELWDTLVKAMRAETAKDALGLQRERLELLNQNVAATAEKVTETMRAKGLDEETLKTIREEIYGLTPAGA